MGIGPRLRKNREKRRFWRFLVKWNCDSALFRTKTEMGGGGALPFPHQIFRKKGESAGLGNERPVCPCVGKGDAAKRIALVYFRTEFRRSSMFEGGVK